MVGGDVAIGDYSTRYVRMKRTTTKNSEYGQEIESWPDSGEAWGKEPDESAADTQHTANQITTRAESTIRLRGYVDIASNDRLRVKSTGEVYRLEGVRRSSTETICEGFRLTEGEV